MGKNLDIQRQTNRGLGIILSITEQRGSGGEKLVFTKTSCDDCPCQLGLFVLVAGYSAQQQPAEDVVGATGTRTPSRYAVILAVFDVDVAQLGLPQEKAVSGL